MKKSILFMSALLTAMFVNATVIDTLKTRVLADLMVTVNATQISTVNSLINSMNANGSWSDITYTSTTQTNWKPLTHLDRVMSMCYVYLKSGQSEYLNASLFAKIDSGLTYWYRVNPTSTNWWYNDIGKQYKLNVIGLLMMDYLRPSLLAKVINDLSTSPSMTGANLTDISTSVIYRGLIEGNLARVNSGLTAISNEIKITTAEGLQIDYSFHQHGALLYNGGYGFVFLSSATYWCEKTAGTTLAFAQSKIALLSGMLLQGNRWMIKGITQDYGADGRGISRPTSSSGTASSCITYATRMANVDVVKSKDLLTMANRIQHAGKQDVSGNRHFWKSDFSVHQRNMFYTSVKMCSKRTVGTQSINDENLKGYWLPFGVNFMFRKGDEYYNIFPVWNWALLPGTTAPYVELLPSGSLTQAETFVGGVTDSTYGVSAMKLNIQNTTAKKAWFFFDNEWVALGTDITSTHASEINTTINQTFLNTKLLLVNGNPISKGTYQFNSLDWVMNDSIAYIFLEKKPVTLKADTQSGNWYNINHTGSTTNITKDVFTLYLPHGKSPVNASYQYAVVPGISPAEAATYYNSPPVAVLKNTSRIQAVTHTITNVTGIVFYQPDTLLINNSLKVSVDHSCIVLLRKTGNNKYSVSIADPEGTAAQIMCALFIQNNVSKTTPFKMPSGDNAGKSVSASIDFGSVSIAETDLEPSFLLHIYPQPNSGIFTLSFEVATPQDLSIQIYDCLGRNLYTENKTSYQGNYKNILNLGNSGSGNYTIKVKAGNHIATGKISMLK